MKKICVLNLSGNVGKSTLAVHLLAAFTPGAKVISVETINASNADNVESVEVEELAASRFKEIFREVLINDDVIVDVGASNVANFMTEMTRFKSSVGEFDLIVVPTVPADKQQKDTIATIEWLSRLGVDGRKVRVVFNQYSTDSLDPVELVYSQVAGYGMSDGKSKAVFEPHAIVAQNEIYELVKGTGKTIKELADDPTDWKEKRVEAKKAGDMDGMEKAIDGQMHHDLAQTAQENLSHVHALLFGGKSKKS